MDSSNPVYYFNSSGTSGNFPIAVVYDQLTPEMVYMANPLPNPYNVGFGVVSGSSLIDIHVINNGDTEEILNTVAVTIADMLAKHPEYSIFASGITESRTRLYRMKITKYLSEFSENYSIYGYKDGTITPFYTGHSYNGFCVTNRK